MEEANKSELIKKLIYELPVLRAKRGMTQNELSEIIGVSRQTYSLLENGKRKMTWSNFLSILFVFYFNSVTRKMLETSGILTDILKNTLNIDHRLECD